MAKINLKSQAQDEKDLIYYSEGFYETFYKKYLKEVVKKGNLIKEEHIKSIFLMALRDFFKGEIDLHSLSSISCELYYEIGKPSEIDANFEKELARALFSATEIFYYQLNKEKDAHNKDIYKKHLQNLKEYYEKHKDNIL